MALAYSLQVFRLVVDRDGVRPGMFPSLEHIEVVLWKPVVSEVDLLPLLQALPEVRSEQGLRMRANLCMNVSVQRMIVCPVWVIWEHCMVFELATFTFTPVHSYASAPFPEEHQGEGGHRAPRPSSGPSDPVAALCRC